MIESTINPEIVFILVYHKLGVNWFMVHSFHHLVIESTKTLYYTRKESVYLTEGYSESQQLFCKFAACHSNPNIVAISASADLRFLIAYCSLFLRLYWLSPKLVEHHLGTISSDLDHLHLFLC